MTYAVVFKGRAERELVELARSLSGLSQAAYTRAVLLKEAYSVVQRAQALQAQEGTSNGFTTEASADNAVSGEAPGEGSDSNMVADTPTAND